MRFLKNKIRLANEALQRRLSDTEEIPNLDDSPLVSEDGGFLGKGESSEDGVSPDLQIVVEKPRHKKRKAGKKKPRKPSSTKNLMINYGKAICTFAVSQLAIPYLEPLLKQENVTLQDFVDFINNSKKTIGGIKSFKTLILNDENDDDNVKAYKRVFRSISIVFIKYFSVNWIMHGKVTHKITYLKYRFKMQRRIENPENFTYVKQRIYKRKNE